MKHIMINIAAIAFVFTMGQMIIPDIALAAGRDWAPCKFEDSNHCVWDAKHMGNGIGRSFFTNDRGVHYISHDRAHDMLNR
jgi:hypothetical protein